MVADAQTRAANAGSKMQVSAAQEGAEFVLHGNGA
jgi:hypothetical protein